MATSGSMARDARREGRRRTILEVAERSFCARGYGATSMSTIAAELGGSKTTLWSYFPSKETLFQAVLDAKIGDFAAQLDQALVPAGGTAAALGRFGRVFLAKILSPDSEKLRRLLASESDRVPGMAAAYYERGPMRTRDRLANFLDSEMAEGRLRAGNVTTAAHQFIALCQSGGFLQRLWHAPGAPPVDIGRDVAEAVDTFLRAWGPQSLAPAGAHG